MKTREESFLLAAALEAGLDTAKPFPFLIEGELIDLEAHVINGACPMRARRFGLSIAPAQQPYRGSFAKTSGRLVGIYAQDAEHRLTHHGTKMQTHVLLKDDNGQRRSRPMLNGQGCVPAASFACPLAKGPSVADYLALPRSESVAQSPRRRLQAGEVAWDAAEMHLAPKPV